MPRYGCGHASEDPGFPESYRLGIVSLLEEVFGILVDEYGEAGSPVNVTFGRFASGREV